jgi:branched-chain amino acid transport system permease protein
MIISGLGGIPGSVFGPVLIITLNEIASHATELLMNIGASIGVGITIAPFREFVYCLAIILFIIFEPKGLR